MNYKSSDYECRYTAFQAMEVFSKTGSVRALLSSVREWNKAGVPDLDCLPGKWLYQYHLNVEKYSGDTM